MPGKCQFLSPGIKSEKWFALANGDSDILLIYVTCTRGVLKTIEKSKENKKKYS